MPTMPTARKIFINSAIPVPPTHKTHSEASTTILIPRDNTAFLNPVQEYNRDMSVAVIRAWNEMRLEEMEGKWRRKKEWAGKKGKAKDEESGVVEAEGVAGPSQVCRGRR